MPDRPIVGIARCAADAPDELVAERLAAAASHLGDLGRLFAGKRKVFVKVNLGVHDVRLHAGRQIALADPGVIRATVALVRRHYAGELLIGDATTDGPLVTLYERLGLPDVLAPFDVRMVDPNFGDFVEWGRPARPLMFSRYSLQATLADVDAFVSLSTMKSHLAAGTTLTLKNLFGLTPTPVYGGPRRYLHAPIRLPRVLADLAQIFRPVLNVVDGLVGQSQQEWGGPPVRTDVLLVGENTVATDATATRLMGHDPRGDYGAYPYLWERNPLVLAESVGVGPAAAEAIDVRGDFPRDGSGRIAPIATFDVGRDVTNNLADVRLAVARQALDYFARRDEYLRDHAGKYIVLAGGRLLAALDDVHQIPRRGELAKKLDESTAAGIFLKRVVPADADPEVFDVYRQVLEGRA